MDDPSIVRDIYAIAEVTANKQVRPEHFVSSAAAH
jgi:hypothetical protein